MKNFFLSALLALGSVSVVSAQQYEYLPDAPGHRRMDFDQVKFGVFIAPNVSWMRPTATKSDDKMYLVSSEGSRLGFTWGLMMDYQLGENYGISTGFQLNNTGGSIMARQNPNMPDQGYNKVKAADFDYKLQFLEVPFALKLKSDDIKPGFRVFGQIGLGAAVNISKKVSYEVDYTDANGTARKAVSDNEKLTGGLAITPFLLSMNVGAGIEQDLTEKLRFYTGLFFSNGFAPDVTNPQRYSLDYAGNFGDGNVRLNNIALRLGIFF